jgi:thioredoxin 1
MPIINLYLRRHMSEVTLTDSNFEEEVIKSTIPVLVDFWAVWCGPCQMQNPILEDVAKEYKGKVKVGKLNVDENPNTAGKYGVMSIPTLMIFKDGQIVKQMVGVQSKETLAGEFKKVI